MIRNQAGQSIGAQMVSAINGAAYVGTVTVYVTIDAGVQTLGSVGSGLCTSEGNGYYTYLPTAAETNGALVAYTFIGTNAVPATIQVATVSAEQLTALQSSAASGSKSVTDICTAALSRINVIQSNETPPPDLLAIAFDRFNDWIDSVCANERLAIYTITSTPFTIVSGTQTYTVGLGGDANINRPIYIDHITYTNSAVTPPLELWLTMLTDDAWAGIPNKTLSGVYPIYAYYNPTFTSGTFGTLNLWYVPSSTTLTGNIYAPAAVTRFNSLTDTVALPPGYNRFLRDNLAVELAAELRENVPVDPSLLKSASESMANIKRANTRLMDLSLDPLLMGRGGFGYSIVAGP